LHKRQGISSPAEFSFSRKIILLGVNYEVQDDDTFIKATNIIFDANPSSGSGVDTCRRMDRHAKILFTTYTNVPNVKTAKYGTKWPNNLHNTYSHR
jgi:hypothetical protein